MVHNVNQVANEAGNSPEIIHGNYRQLVQPADAEKWFAITPETVAAAKAEQEGKQPENVVPMPAAAVG